MKKCQLAAEEKLQKQILSTLKFSKVRTEALDEKIGKLSNEIAIDMQALKKSNPNYQKKVTNIDGMIITEAGESLDIKKVVSKLEKMN